MRILLVEDEFALADVIKDRLEQDLLEVDIAYDGAEGEYMASSGIYDLIVLDGMLPEIDGYDILLHLREQSITCPILMLTARSELSDKLKGLNNGADDYMTKPFEMEELLARINALLRRKTGFNSIDLSFGDISLNKHSGMLVCSATERSINISSKELLLMEYFLVNKNHILSREQISERIWGITEDVEYNNVEVYISFLRKKLKYLGADTTIHTVRGLGYRLEE